jgi:hypothetical protein
MFMVEGFVLVKGEHTLRPLLADNALQDPIEQFTSHLPSKHENNFDFATGPYKSHIGNT